MGGENYDLVWLFPPANFADDIFLLYRPANSVRHAEPRTNLAGMCRDGSSEAHRVFPRDHGPRNPCNLARKRISAGPTPGRPHAWGIGRPRTTPGRCRPPPKAPGKSFFSGEPPPPPARNPATPHSTALAIWGVPVTRPPTSSVSRRKFSAI